MHQHELNEAAPEGLVVINSARPERSVIPTGAGAPATAEWRDLVLSCDQTMRAADDHREQSSLISHTPSPSHPQRPPHISVCRDRETAPPDVPPAPASPTG